MPARWSWPTPSKKAVIRSKRPVLATAALTTAASEPAPAGPISGRFERMTAFFDGVGQDHRAGIWPDAGRLPPKDKPVAAKPLVAAKASVKMEDF
jgi:chlorophyllide a reductase subunit Y